MRRPLLALLLLSCPAVYAADERPEKPERGPRKALEEAACGPGAPALLVRRPRAAAATPAPDATPAAANHEEVDTGDGCETSVGGWPDGTEVALRPEGALTPENVAAAFAKSRKVEDLAATLTAARARLDAPAPAASSWLDSLFDNRFTRPDDADKVRQLRGTLTDTLSVAAAPATVPVTDARAPTKTTRPIVGKVPDPKGPPAWYDPALNPSEVAPILRNDDQPYTDGRGLWPFPSRTGPPAGMTFPQNMAGVPATGPGQPVSANDRSAPIWGPFYEKFKACAKQIMGTDECEPYNYGIFRQSAMCHGQSRAIDVHAMKCGGTIHRAIDNGRFEQVTLCIKAAGMKTIWKQCFINCTPFNKTSHHYDHGHFSIGCPPPFRW